MRSSSLRWGSTRLQLFILTLETIRLLVCHKREQKEFVNEATEVRTVKLRNKRQRKRKFTPVRQKRPWEKRYIQFKKTLSWKHRESHFIEDHIENIDSAGYCAYRHLNRFTFAACCFFCSSLILYKSFKWRNKRSCQLITAQGLRKENRWSFCRNVSQNG